MSLATEAGAAVLVSPQLELLDPLIELQYRPKDGPIPTKKYRHLHQQPNATNSCTEGLTALGPVWSDAVCKNWGRRKPGL